MQKMCGVVWCYAGGADDAQAALAPIRAQLPAALDGVAEMPFPALQSAFDGLYTPGDQWYWRADFVETIPADAIEAHVAHAPELPTWKSTMHLYPVDGAAGRVPSDATAWGYRNVRWAQVIVGVDPDPANASAIRDWTVELLGGAPPLRGRRRLQQLPHGRRRRPRSRQLRPTTTNDLPASRRSTTRPTSSTSTRTSSRPDASDRKGGSR